MNKLVVICNVEHRIEPELCAFCERDEADKKVEKLIAAAKLVCQKATHKQGKAGQEFTDAINKLRDVTWFFEMTKVEP